KAPGPDRIPADLYKALPDFWGPLITNVLRSAVVGPLVDSWKEAIIVPIFKKRDRADSLCYRPISLLDSS
ncbi:hypothetical protein NDU88_001978, partial [Pleurodeles waltl]